MPVTVEPLGSTDFHSGQRFEDLDLSGRSLEGVELVGCELSRVKLANARWSRCRFESCTVIDSDLTQLALREVACRGLRFEGCKLMGVEWRALAPSPELTFVGCDLRYASFVDLSLRKTLFERCLAREANFLGVDLAGASFVGSDLGAATFRDCVLEKADFSGTSGLFLEPGRNRVKGARVPVETAVLLAEAAGLKVVGFSPEPAGAPASLRARRGKPG